MGGSRPLRLRPGRAPASGRARRPAVGGPGFLPAPVPRGLLASPGGLSTSLRSVPPDYASAYGYAQTSGKAIAVLVLGITGLVLFTTGILGIGAAIAALVMAPSARRQIAASGGRLTGSGMVTAGVVTAWVGLALSLLLLVALVGLAG